MATTANQNLDDNNQLYNLCIAVVLPRFDIYLECMQGILPVLSVVDSFQQRTARMWLALGRHVDIYLGCSLHIHRMRSTRHRLYYHFYQAHI